MRSAGRDVRRSSCSSPSPYVHPAAGTPQNAAATPWSPTVDVEAVVQRVDAAGRELVLRVWVTPRGAFGEADGAAPVAELDLQTSGTTLSDPTFAAHERLTTRDVRVALTGGSISDYPFDTYETDIAFRARLDGKQGRRREIAT
ncbi:DUF4436 family protein [Streptomyces sp. NPDC002324]